MSVDLEKARSLIREGEFEAATSEIEASDSPIEVATAYHSLGKNLYWKDKSLPLALDTFRYGIECALRLAADSEDPNVANELRGRAKAMCFDTASFCWPGWDEPGIEIGESQLAEGEEAAKKNLQFAIELQRGAVPMANAHFMIGAYQLARQNWPDARTSFRLFREHAEASGDADLIQLADGYLALCRWRQDDPDAEHEFRAVVETLDAVEGENGSFFAEQLTTAARVFA